jgi:hypothetical protein
LRGQHRVAILRKLAAHPGKLRDAIPAFRTFLDMPRDFRGLARRNLAIHPRNQLS